MPCQPNAVVKPVRIRRVGYLSPPTPRQRCELAVARVKIGKLRIIREVHIVTVRGSRQVNPLNVRWHAHQDCLVEAIADAWFSRRVEPRSILLLYLSCQIHQNPAALQCLGQKLDCGSATS